ncbi:hypothetical protein [Xanthomonas sp. LMC-A-07]|uniref:hypothetical protein n=1 Tax=Xanthomonas sp. LMC-A-07 TaxID=3040329 RepID=UPI0025570D62|nr:hypothetical protein [Xanthomonas sp. LMC-A-07]
MSVHENENRQYELKCPIPQELDNILKSHPAYLSRLQNALDQFSENLPGGEFSTEKYGPAYKRMMDMVCATLNEFHREASQDLDAAIVSVRLAESVCGKTKNDFFREVAEKRYRDFSAFPVYRDYFSDLSPVVEYLASRGK